MADADGLMSATPGAAADAGSANTISGTTGGAVAAGMARVDELASDTYTAGSVIGDVMTLPPNPVSANYGSALGADSGQVQVPAQQGGTT